MVHLAELFFIFLALNNMVIFIDLNRTLKSPRFHGPLHIIALVKNLVKVHILDTYNHTDQVSEA